MGYSSSIRTVKRVEIYLQQMLNSTENIEFPVEDASKFAYQLRDGIRTAKKLSVDKHGMPVEPFATYQRLSAKYIVRTRNNRVVCELRDVVPTVQLLGKLNLPGIVDTLTIIGAAIKHKAPVMVFPDASSKTVDETRLKLWAVDHGYDTVVSDNHVTLERA